MTSTHDENHFGLIHKAINTNCMGLQRWTFRLGGGNDMFKFCKKKAQTITEKTNLNQRKNNNERQIYTNDDVGLYD